MVRKRKLIETEKKNYPSRKKVAKLKDEQVASPSTIVEERTSQWVRSNFDSEEETKRSKIQYTKSSIKKSSIKKSSAKTLSPTLSSLHSSDGTSTTANKVDIPPDELLQAFRQVAQRVLGAPQTDDEPEETVPQQANDQNDERVSITYSNASTVKLNASNQQATDDTNNVDSKIPGNLFEFKKFDEPYLVVPIKAIQLDETVLNDGNYMEEMTITIQRRLVKNVNEQVNNSEMDSANKENTPTVGQNSSEIIENESIEQPNFKCFIQEYLN